MFTDRFTRAVNYARIAHAGQVRKGTDIPSITHLLAVAALVIEFGGNEDQAIASLLHDTLRDCGAEHEPFIRAQFGNAVADIVLACADAAAEDNPVLADAEAKRCDWPQRKRAWLAHLAEAHDAVLLVSGCDALHHARTIVQDLEDPLVGMQVFARLNGGPAATLAYYESLSRLLLARQNPTANVLDAAVERMHALAGGARREQLRGGTRTRHPCAQEPQG